ncbi:MAG: bifunctional hydroxymethylpyrimidine kinase/phosphomethylpyrimidine kinase, partial [bacterium]
MKTALTIAGFDPTSGAGITADLKVFHALKVYGIGIVSSLTAQNTLGITGIESVPRLFVREQMRGILDDISPDAVKTGMIYEKDIIRIVCSEIDRGRIRNLVVDPVITSTSGKTLIKKDAIRALIDELIPRALVVTPNIPEAGEITGMEIKDIDDMRRAAERIQALGPEHVIITGGH